MLDPDREWKEIKREGEAADRYANSVVSPTDYGVGLSKEELKLLEESMPQREQKQGWFKK